ncbi:MAG TPA: hypothetical protein VGH03_17030 [Caulobacteraceae bacterium]|jgi:hypothetical protein
MSYAPRDSKPRRPHLRAVESTQAIASHSHAGGLPEALFTGLTAAVFLVLMAAVAAAAILYSRGA